MRHVLLKIVVRVHFWRGASSPVKVILGHRLLPANGVLLIQVLAQMNGGVYLLMVIVNAILLLRLLLIFVLVHNTSETHCPMHFFVIDAIVENF